MIINIIWWTHALISIVQFSGLQYNPLNDYFTKLPNLYMDNLPFIWQDIIATFTIFLHIFIQVHIFKLQKQVQNKYTKSKKNEYYLQIILLKHQ